MFLKYTLYLRIGSPPVMGLEPRLQKISLKSSGFLYKDLNIFSPYQIFLIIFTYNKERPRLEPLLFFNL